MIGGQVPGRWHGLRRDNTVRHQPPSPTTWTWSAESASRCLSGRDGLLGESPRPVGGAAGEGRLPAGRGCPGFPEDGVTMPFRKLQEAGAIQGRPGRCGLTLRAGWGDRAVTRERAAFSSPGWPAADSSAGAVEVAVAFDMRVVVTGGDLALRAAVLALPTTGRQLAAGASAMWTASGAPRSCEPWVLILPPAPTSTIDRWWGEAYRYAYELGRGPPQAPGRRVLRMPLSDLSPGDGWVPS